VTDTIITVRGRFSSCHPPERATVGVTIGFEGRDRESVFTRAMAAAGDIRELILARHSPDTGPITWWSSDSVQVWITTPWNADGVQLPGVFHSRLGFTVTFSDFEAMARWIEAVAVLDGASVDGISWALTEARTTAATAEVRSRAVKDAVAKASVYAQSIGLGSVRAVALADPGMLGDQVGTSPSSLDTPSMRMMAAGAAPELSLTPRDIEVEAVVDARFVAT
jgi:hypothetical protein